MDVYLQDPNDYVAFNSTYAEYFEPPYSARLTVDMMIKMARVAYLGR